VITGDPGEVIGELVDMLRRAKNAIATLRPKHSITSVELEIEHFLEGYDLHEPDQEDDDPFS